MGLNGSFPSLHIRPVDVRRDLYAVADLVELCFSATMDVDGREYLRHIRRLAADVSKLTPISYPMPSPVEGYVWEQEGKVVGNVTLIPFSRPNHFVYLIANVAVHPDFRGRGIGRELTLRAMEHAKRRRAAAAWLQVRDDNPGAHKLYIECGFIERVRRTNWLWEPGINTERLLQTEISVGGRASSDWKQQLAWLEETYPPEVSWNLNIQPERFSPGVLQWLMRSMNGEKTIHAAARLRNELIGTATWEPARAYADVIWLGVDPRREDVAIRNLLPALRVQAGALRPLTVNYPADAAVSAFQQSGFRAHNTLIWMQYRFAANAT